MKIKVFSEDAIQRIASGNEPTQTLISLDVLKNVMKPHQLRNVLGGGSGYCCYWESETDRGCVSHPVEAEFMGTVHWCCGNWEAKQNCGC